MAEAVVWKVVHQSDGYALEEIRLNSQEVSLDSLSRLLPDGSYTTFRTYDGNKVIRLSQHLERLQTAAHIVQRNGFIIDNGLIRSALNDVIQRNPAQNLRIRLTLDLEDELGAVYIAVELLSPLPAEAYRCGIKTVTCDVEREIPKAKLTNFITPASEIRSQLPADINEALIIDEDGKILEGLSSNFFAVKDGVVWTAEEKVLPGVTRSIVIDEIRKEGIPIHLWALPVDEIDTIQEAFITSSSRGVLPVVQIDDTIIGAGEPGIITQKVRQRYDNRINDELEEI